MLICLILQGLFVIATFLKTFLLYIIIDLKFRTLIPTITTSYLLLIGYAFSLDRREGFFRRMNFNTIILFEVCC